MGELEDKLNQILSDPAELERLGRLASQLFGTPEPEQPPQGAADGAGAALRAMLNGGGVGDKARLVGALSPWLRPDRQRRLRRALQTAQAARIALRGMEALGGDGDV